VATPVRHQCDQRQVTDESRTNRFTQSWTVPALLSSVRGGSILRAEPPTEGCFDDRLADSIRAAPVDADVLPPSSIRSHGVIHRERPIGRPTRTARRRSSPGARTARFRSHLNEWSKYLRSTRHVHSQGGLRLSVFGDFLSICRWRDHCLGLRAVVPPPILGSPASSFVFVRGLPRFGSRRPGDRRARTSISCNQ
jgi:hypothetical protein